MIDSFAKLKKKKNREKKRSKLFLLPENEIIMSRILLYPILPESSLMGSCAVWAWAGEIGERTLSILPEVKGESLEEKGLASLLM